MTSKPIVLAFVMTLLPVKILAWTNVDSTDPMPESDPGFFYDVEPLIASAPASPVSFLLPPDTEPVALDVSLNGLETAVVVKRSAEDTFRVVFWNVGSPEQPDEWAPPKDFIPVSIAWHPKARLFFLAGKQKKPDGDAGHAILQVKNVRGEWEGKQIYASGNEIDKLMVNPRPFSEYGNSTPGLPERFYYRLFFGQKTENGAWGVVTLTEDGRAGHQIVGPASGMNEKYSFNDPQNSENTCAVPGQTLVEWAMPAATHPSGAPLLWFDREGKLYSTPYDWDDWGEAVPLEWQNLAGFEIVPTPNGLGFLRWKRGAAGVGIVLDAGKTVLDRAPGVVFTSCPRFTPDGRGVVGTMLHDGEASISYVPIEQPLADVVNAWMFSTSPEERELLHGSGGLLRPIGGGAGQLYQLYDTETYYCGGWTDIVPTRPYMITTDIFWENFAAAYEGLFIVSERSRAMPEFWNFVAVASEALSEKAPESKWGKAFRAIAALKNGSFDSEAELIRKSEKSAASAVTGENFHFEDLLPRGHYTATEDGKKYYQAVHYLTMLSGLRNMPLDELEALPSGVKEKALAWIAVYNPFIAAGEGRLVWNGVKSPPPYVRHPSGRDTVFPLSWGFDNEVLNSAVFHGDWPAEEQIRSGEDIRVIPSGLDFAAVMGSRFAKALLGGEITRFPPLGAVLGRLAESSVETAKAKQNLYDQWLSALGIQWAEDVAPPDGPKSETLWKTKRLQTGLASWTTLRHATVLVNATGAAECGEGGFEAMHSRLPRGYVEPDPATFEALADLFESTEKMVLEGSIPLGDEQLKNGATTRLGQSAQKARLFASMARKELQGKALTAADYADILWAGRVAEHFFILFKSLAGDENALSEPDPMAKIAEVAGGGRDRIPWLMAAVGNPLEWDQIVPYFGRREIVKGPVYSYYEFTSDTVLNDETWRRMADGQPRPVWIDPFVSAVPAEKLSYPPVAPY